MVLSGKSRNWCWMPTLTFLIGIFSLILLIWVERINERLLIDGAIVDAFMDVQNHTSTYHIRLEEVISGVAAVDVSDAFAALDQAIYLVDVTLKGGKSENDWVLEPLNKPEQRNRAEEVKSLLLKLKSIGALRLKNPEKFGIESSIERQFEMVFKEVLSRARSLELSLEIDKAGNSEKSRRLLLSIIVIWAFIVIAASGGIWAREVQRKNAEAELLKLNELLHSQADELTVHREHLAELVERRTAELSTANKLVLAEMSERLQLYETLKEAEKQIIALSSRLIDAQEIERKRIAMGLHDELGQALTVTKLRIRVIANGLRDDQLPIKGACEELLEYMDQVIENVRRLSLALSPTILEDLGLTSALQWLVSNLTNIQNVKVASDIAEIDQLLQKKHWITIYRIVQEALTNIGKHADAEHVSVVVQRLDGKIAFSIEDDGKGFDPEQAALVGAAEKGFGLEIMKERVGILGGVLDLWSQRGQGTSISFSVPIESRGA